MPSFPLRSAAAAGLLALAVLPTSALAWGAVGHRLIADVAMELLPTATRAQVERLLALEPGASLPSVSTWPDEVRTPRTARWHYTSFPRDGDCRIEPARECPDGQCAVGALQREAATLGSGNAEPQIRLEALKWVVHLVGDIHQPLHGGFHDDRGGNQFQLQAFGRGTNLHSLWDSGLIQHWPGGETALRGAVAAWARKPLAAVSAEQWTLESCQLVRSDAFYPAAHELPEGYEQRWQPEVVERMGQAAHRLADLLQQALPPN